MVASPEDLFTPENLINGLSIVGEDGQRSYLDSPWTEQEQYLEWFYRSLRGEAPRNAYILKSRQMGISTVVVASLFIKAYLAPPSKPRNILTIGHEEGACKRMIRMVRNFVTELPEDFRPSLDPDNKFSLGLGHNGSTWASLMAGGRGQGRSETYNDLHATEMAFWPRSSSAVADSDTAADRDAWSSVAAVLHDPEAHRIIESTANGPKGFFYEMNKRASTEDAWQYFFFPWTMQRRYRRVVVDPDAWWAEADQAERELFRAKACTLEQLAFRRHKLRAEGYSLLRFRREYPLTRLEPWLAESGDWFDSERLNAMTLVASTYRPPAESRSRWSNDYTEWVPPEAGRHYGIGVDTSGGTGGDEAVIYVLRDDYTTVAKWHSNRFSPRNQARILSQIYEYYGSKGNAPDVWLEGNKFGEEVGKAAIKLGVRIHKPKGRFWYSTGQNSGNNKRQVYTWGRVLIEQGIPTIYCEETIQQLQNIVEHENGTIGPNGRDDADDLADGWIFAAKAASFAARKFERDKAAMHTDGVARFEERIGRGA